MTEGLRLTVHDRRHAARDQARMSILDAIGAELPKDEPGTIHHLENIVLRVVGMLSSTDAIRLEHRLARLDGVESAAVNFRDETATVSVLDGRLSPDALAYVIREAGFGAWPRETVTLAPEDVRELHQRRTYQRAMLTLIPAVGVFASTFVFDVLGWGSFWLRGVVTDVQLFLFVATFWFGRDLFLRAAREMNWRGAACELPLALSAFITAMASMVAFFQQSHPQFDLAVAIVATYHVGNWIRVRIQQQAERHLSHLEGMRPRLANVRRNEREFRVRLQDIVPGDKVVVYPGEIIPVDGLVLDGQGDVDQSLLFGEGDHRSKGVDDTIYAGSLNGTGTFIVAPRRVGKSTVFGHLLGVMEDSRQSRAPVQVKALKFAAWVTPIAVLVSIATFVYWHNLGHSEARDFWYALKPAIAVLILSTPWALGWVAAVSVTAGMSQAARDGVLFRDAAVLEALRELDVMVFEKAGTLTRDCPEVTAFEVEGDDVDPRAILQVVLALEKPHEHPISKALVVYAESRISDEASALPEVSALRTIPGKGVIARVGGKETVFGTRALLLEKGVAVSDDGRQSGPGSYYYLSIQQRVYARFLIHDAIRDDAVTSVARARGAGMRAMLITALDNGAANRIATAVGIQSEDVRYGLDATAHMGAIRVLRAAGYRVGVVGNSDSDQPSLGAAHVAFALISGGRLPAERYGISLLRPGQGGVSKALDWARRTFRLIRYNILLSVAVMLAAVPAALGYVPVHVAMALMLASVTVVGLNGLRNRPL